MDAETNALVNGLLGTAAAGWILYTTLVAPRSSNSQRSDSLPQQASAESEGIAPDRRSIRQRTHRNKLLFSRRNLLYGKYQLRFACSCDKCMPNQYFNGPQSCELKHLQPDLEIRPWLIPELKSGYAKGPYEALHLARSAIEYFSRPLSDMDTEQRAAVDAFRNWANRQNFIDALNQYDTRAHCDTEWLDSAQGYFGRIFFLEALDFIVALDWDAADLEARGGALGRTHRKDEPDGDGTQISVIQLHPTRTDYRERDYAARGQTLAEARMGTILHEMLHSFLMKHACKQCYTQLVNTGSDGHGRAWHLLAKAIEEQSMRLIGMNVDLGRLTTWEITGGKDGTSVHDMETYGFIEPTAPDGELDEAEA